MDMKKIAVAVALLAGGASSDAMYDIQNGVCGMKRDVIITQ
ncbi:hypothetical protein FACS189449_06110 [Alphaproteobacteria bacterium]|nr:hypothetical protein FACS189449_06110 [Alphaproteobacteria bacterium]